MYDVRWGSGHDICSSELKVFNCWSQLLLSLLVPPQAVSKIREFILQKIYSFRKPMTNYQIPQNTLLKYRWAHLIKSRSSTQTTGGLERPQYTLKDLKSNKEPTGWWTHPSAPHRIMGVVVCCPMTPDHSYVIGKGEKCKTKDYHSKKSVNVLSFLIWKWL